MRIIAGINKGKRLIGGDSKEIRPTLARVRKSFFDILGDFVVDADVLDLFAGSGALGVESLGRGARYVMFVDSSKRALKIIRENLKACGFNEFGRTKLSVLPSGLGNITGKFSLVFIDPPYDLGLTEPTLLKLSEGELLLKGAKILTQVSKREELLDHYGKIVLKKERRYGDTKLYLYDFF